MEKTKTEFKQIIAILIVMSIGFGLLQAWVIFSICIFFIFLFTILLLLGIGAKFDERIKKIEEKNKKNINH